MNTGFLLTILSAWSASFSGMHFFISSSSSFNCHRCPIWSWKPSPCPCSCFFFSSVQSLSRVQLCDPMDCSTPGFPVHHQLPEPTQTYVLCISDAIQPSHPLSSPSPPTFNLSKHEGFFQWVSSSHQVAKILELQLQHQSFQWIFRTDLL